MMIVIDVINNIGIKLQYTKLLLKNRYSKNPQHQWVSEKLTKHACHSGILVTFSYIYYIHTIMNVVYQVLNNAQPVLAVSK